MRRGVLALSGLFLAGFGLAVGGAVLASHVERAGPFAGAFAVRMPYATIAFFQGAGLSAVLGAAMLYVSTDDAPPRLWHVVGLAVHLLMLMGNLAWWDSFRMLGTEEPAMAVTALHGVFAVLQAVCLVVGARGTAGR